MALYQKCPHLGCRVPSCATSQWFECPCHGSQYNRVGEKKAGPAPRGMDRFPVTVGANGDVIVSTGTIVTGPAHRHQHDRTGGGRAALHHRRWCALMVALATTTIAYILLAIVIGGWIVYALPQRAPVAQQRRLGDRAGSQSQAVLRRRDVGGPTARTRPADRRPPARRGRHRAAAVLDLRARPHARRGGGRRGDVHRARRGSCSRRPATTCRPSTAPDATEA